jgi:hypothetical protein
MRAARKIVKISSVRLIAGLGLIAMTAGCVSEPNTKLLGFGGVDSRSPVAAEVDAATRSPGPYPRFDRIPPAPSDVRSGEAWRSAVAAERADGRTLQAQADALPFTLKGTDDYAQNTRGRIDQGLAVQAPPGAEASARAFADTQRARATPPPRPN